MYRKIVQTAVIVAYTGDQSVNSQAAVATAQIAGAGVPDRGSTRRRNPENGSPPSRANAKAIRDAEVTAPSPQPYIASAIPNPSAADNRDGRTASIAWENARSPFAAAASRSGIASTTA